MLLVDRSAVEVLQSIRTHLTTAGYVAEGEVELDVQKLVEAFIEICELIDLIVRPGRHAEADALKRVIVLLLPAPAAEAILEALLLVADPEGQA